MTTPRNIQDQVTLDGVRVLVVEDDYFIADEICNTLRAHGAEVIGPSPDVEQGRRLARTQPIDCAVLDINLQGDLAFGLANELRERDTPAIFATGYDDSVLPEEFTGVVRLEKPVNLRALLQAVHSCVRSETTSNT
ncbi:response regulator [Steroidobacter sp. S1-65]|uniref:Response regulator n=1 Tax=Steroidobacter gossypii TaxID=2805490 RepID=A0ABS1X492_9GAMM|nr:response regulator [Steroidobacter gossypii]MBM0108047.1 response regulator [Steroidobacter gossypii]